MNGACQRREADTSVAPSRGGAPSLAVSAALAAPSTLPEDPEAGARSVAQWRDHLEEEERERRLNYDRRKLADDRRVVSILRTARTRYDRAADERAVLSAQKTLRAARPQLEKAFDSIDHWGVSSKTLPEYRQLVELFSEAYPSARVAALSGSRTSLDELERRVNAHFESIDSWLHEAAESEDE
jgi:hypothetical protein